MGDTTLLTSTSTNLLAFTTLLTPGIMFTYQETRERLLKNETPAEKAFAKILDKMGVRYTKQKIVFHYKQYMIADFYLEEKGWLVEIDGEYHFTRKQMKKDKRRDQKIQKWFGYKILRFTNDEVLTGGKWIENVINHGFNDW